MWEPNHLPLFRARMAAGWIGQRRENRDASARLARWIGPPTIAVKRQSPMLCLGRFHWNNTLEDNPMKKTSLLAVALISVVGAQTARAQNKGPAWSADLNQIRQTARAIPGALPLRVNVLKFAESRRTKNFSVKGAPTEPSVQARTVYQVVYPDGYVMIDSGMDLQVHKFFGRGVEEPYFPEAAGQVEKALRGAKSIVMTHEHGDHVAGVIRTPFSAELAPKTTLTKTQVQT